MYKWGEFLHNITTSYLKDKTSFVKHDVGLNLEFQANVFVELNKNFVAIFQCCWLFPTQKLTQPMLIQFKFCFEYKVEVL